LCEFAGTDATIHEHIKKVLEREYVFKVRNMFYPSTLGVALVVGYDSMSLDLSKPVLRAQASEALRLKPIGCVLRLIP